ncbi:hypothetical protein B1757_02820 [Acidithiobacillus marinus]|uniref:Uncharacterized protein n=1 Tax=Acidithiobacillus marinus TaxID=187490 RepID=A0A2I1DPF4_9PROT|nr:hypothetical protein [Acidithiobacillus marinus]PKY11740.1 hypothetical protein B1757_02820 [Acidithiobacillus marinus]
MLYKTEEYQDAWLGLPVSHPHLGGGIVMRVVAARAGTLVSVHFASGLKKVFAVDQFCSECRSLLNIGSFRNTGSDPDTLLANPQRMRVALQDAQWRHQMQQWALESDLDDRLNRAAGYLQPPIRKPHFDWSSIAF